MKKEEKCYLCGAICSVDSTSVDNEPFFAVECDSCGEYNILAYPLNYIQKCGKRIGYKLSAILKERYLQGYPDLVIADDRSCSQFDDSMTIDQLISLYPKNAIEMLERSLLNLTRLIEHPCDEVSLDIPQLKPLMFAKNKHNADRMLKLLEDSRYIECDATSNSIDLQLTVMGWAKASELKQMSKDSKQVFVAMSFDSDMNGYFENGIKPGIEASGDYQVLRVDLVEHLNKICDQIIAEIRRSRFIVADFTKNRGGVYFEAGYAMGLGIPVIWTIEKTFFDSEEVHFDTRQYNHIVYETPEDLKSKLTNRIRATIV